jgi:hypothetical protein
VQAIQVDGGKQPDTKVTEWIKEKGRSSLVASPRGKIWQRCDAFLAPRKKTKSLIEVSLYRCTFADLPSGTFADGELVAIDES